jgi:hypothetical protein
MAKPKETQTIKGESNPEMIAAAIAEGKALIEQGKTKIDAAMAIYAKLETETQEVVVAAFVEGASLTPKGALTYWYNCRRKIAKKRLTDGKMNSGQ